MMSARFFVIVAISGPVVGGVVGGVNGGRIYRTNELTDLNEHA